MHRLDRLIQNIYELQEPYLQGGSAADVLLVFRDIYFCLALSWQHAEAL